MGKYCFGIDVGGTTVKCGLFETDGTLLDKWEIVTRTENGGENVLPDIAATIVSKMTVKGRYMIDTPIFHTLCHSHGAYFEDLIEPAH